MHAAKNSLPRTGWLRYLWSTAVPAKMFSAGGYRRANRDMDRRGSFFTDLALHAILASTALISAQSRSSSISLDFSSSGRAYQERPPVRVKKNMSFRNSASTISSRVNSGSLRSLRLDFNSSSTRSLSTETILSYLVFTITFRLFCEPSLPLLREAPDPVRERP